MHQVLKLRKYFKRKPVQLMRNLTQIIFASFLLYVGYRFYQFYLHFASSGAQPFVERPSAVEGFLPISALVAFKVWITSGHFDTIHPAGLLLLMFIVGSGFLFRKAFCSWMCPIGTLSEFTGKLGKKIFQRNVTLPRWLTWFLYPLKYLLLIFFIKFIIFDMPSYAAYQFLNSPYNKVSDIKMMLFFLNISEFAFRVIVILFAISLVIKNFWCRFLCPYGALIGIASLVNISKITRNEQSCIDCNNCTRVCPSGIQVAKKKSVLTPECSACMECIEACPVKDTLHITVAKKKTNKWVIPIAFFAIFFTIVAVAKLTGVWKTSVTYDEFETLIRYINSISH